MHPARGNPIGQRGGAPHVASRPVPVLTLGQGGNYGGRTVIRAPTGVPARMPTPGMQVHGSHVRPDAHTYVTPGFDGLPHVVPGTGRGRKNHGRNQYPHGAGFAPAYGAHRPTYYRQNTPVQTPGGFWYRLGQILKCLFCCGH